MQQLKADVQARSTRDSYDLEEKYLSTSIRAIKDVAAYVPLLAKLKNLKRLSLRKNEITYLPGTFVGLKGLQELDLSANPISNVESIVAILKGLPLLRELSIAIPNRDVEELLMRNLPSLQFLNGKNVSRVTQTKITAESVAISIDSDYLLKLSEIYDGLNRRLLATENGSARVSLNEQFEQTFSALTESLELAAGNPNLAAIRTVSAKVSLETFCMDTMVDCLKAIGNDELADSLTVLVGLIRKDYHRLENLFIVQMKDKIDKTISIRTEEFQRLNRRIEELRSEVHELEGKVADLEVENSTYLNRIIQHSKGVALENTSKLSETRLLSYSSGLELPPDKKLSQLQVEEFIGEIYEMKRKQEEAAGRTQPMSSYIGKFFIWKFGVEGLAHFYQRLFTDSLDEYSGSRSNWILTFLRIRGLECEESYIEEQHKVLERIKVVIRRCVQEHQSDLTELELSRVMESKMYDFYSNNNTKLEETTVAAILNIIYSQEEAAEIRTLLEEHMWSEKRTKLEGSMVSLSRQSPSKSTYRFRPPLPISTPSPRSRASPSKRQAKSITYKRLLNTILNVELNKHLERLQRTTLLFRGYDERQEGILSFSKLIDLLNDQQLQIDNELLLILSQYSQETRSTRRQPSQEELYELMLQGDDNLQITYSRFIDFAKKKFHRGKNLLDIINKRSE